MNFDFSDEELALKEQARRFLEGQATIKLNKEMLDGRGSQDAKSLWAGVCALGWPGAAIPEVYGGHGLGYVALCAIAEEVGRAVAPLPMLPSIYLAAESLLLAGSELQKQRWLPAIASGELIGTVALEGALTLRDGLLHGTLEPIAQGGAAGLAIVPGATVDGTRSLFIVDLAQDGVAREALHIIDDSHPHARLKFDGAVGEQMGAAGAADDLLQRVKTRAAVLVAFEQVGGSEACLDMAVAYAMERKSFGKLIASYQAIKHKLANIYIYKEMARSNAYYAAWALANNAPELDLAAATARVSAIESYEFASEENLQTHGGIGFTWEADCGVHYRRALLLAHALGVSAEWQNRLVAALDVLKVA